MEYPTLKNNSLDLLVSIDVHWIEDHDQNVSGADLMLVEIIPLQRNGTNQRKGNLFIVSLHTVRANYRLLYEHILILFK